MADWPGRPSGQERRQTCSVSLPSLCWMSILIYIHVMKVGSQCQEKGKLKNCTYSCKSDNVLLIAVWVCTVPETVFIQCLK